MLLGNRYYDPAIGRFLSQDPAQDESNWYSYCGNNPLVAVDPSGLFPQPNPGVFDAQSIIDSANARADASSAELLKRDGGRAASPVPMAEATFSSCFGQPFLPLAPEVYANMLAAKLKKTGVPVYLVNTGWSGGPYGVGSRMDIAYTRAMVHVAMSG
jgi:uncharacterized protein RhaS with RHS repeats